jgi:hypothetical protein
MNARIADLQQHYSDLFKDVHGFRPRSLTPDTEEALIQGLDSLSKQLDAQMIEEAAEQQDAIIHFEAELTHLMSIGAPDRATALRWMLDANDSGDLEHLCWQMNLPYNYFPREAA